MGPFIYLNLVPSHICLPGTSLTASYLSCACLPRQKRDEKPCCLLLLPLPTCCPHCHTPLPHILHTHTHLFTTPPLPSCIACITHTTWFLYPACTPPPCLPFALLYIYLPPPPPALYPQAPLTCLLPTICTFALVLYTPAFYTPLLLLPFPSTDPFYHHPTPTVPPPYPASTTPHHHTHTLPSLPPLFRSCMDKLSFIHHCGSDFTSIKTIWG